MQGETPLKGRREKFCQNYATGLKSLTQAYIEAGYSRNEASKNAHRLAKNDGVKARIAYLQRQSIEDTEQDIKRIKTYLRAVIDDAATPHAAKLKACDLLGKTAGIYAEKATVSGTVTYRWEE